MTTNALRAKIAAGEKTFGGWCTTPSPFAAEMLGDAGFDYVCIDTQHGLIHYDAMWPMIQALRATGATPVVRVPFNNTEWPGKAFDAGAEAVIVPMVNTRADAEKAAAACRYAPDGVRSFGPVRAGGLLGQDPATVNREVMCLVMIETTTAIENVDDIVSTPGVDGVYIGPADLAISMGVGLHEIGTAPAHVEAMELVKQKCLERGIVIGLHTGSGAQARMYADQGFQMCTIGTDASIFRVAAAGELAATRHADSGQGSANPYG
jgi:4-hydroxy-2-oxoheptanedioate aldolase